jgi:hypothetical protein
VEVRPKVAAIRLNSRREMALGGAALLLSFLWSSVFMGLL